MVVLTIYHSEHLEQRLQRIELSLEAHSNALATLTSSHSLRDADLDADTPVAADVGAAEEEQSHGTAVSPTVLRTSGREENTDIARDETSTFFGMPVGHRTNTSSLFTLPQVRTLVGIFPEDYFFLLEARRSIPASISLTMSPLSNNIPLLDRAVTDTLVERFFDLVHPWHPILDRQEFLEEYETMMEKGPRPDQRCALCLVVFALGSIASKPMQSTGLSSDQIPGSAYFQPAIHILVGAWMQSFDNDILLSQGLVLSAIYYMYLLLPLQGWRLIHMASTTIQQILTRSGFSF